MKQLSMLIILAFCLVAFSFVPERLFQTPQGWPEPTYNFNENPLSEEKILLGRVLFHDPVLSKDNTISCTSCHSQYSAFTHIDHKLSHGIDDRIGSRNAPALMNLAWQDKFMWDGSIVNLDMQSLAPISHPDEMGEDMAHIVTKLQGSKKYPTLFKDAFGDTSITGERILKSLSQFMLTMVSSNSKYDKVMRNEEQFTSQEQNGYQLFVKNCASCHKEPLFTTNAFANNGLTIDSNLLDFGRMKITKNDSDSLLFKIPTLRNIEFSYPYMHDGRFNSLGKVLDHYQNGIQKSSTLSKELKDSLHLSSNDKVDIIAFLLTLSDKEFLFNKKFNYPKEIFFPAAKE